MTTRAWDARDDLVPRPLLGRVLRRRRARVGLQAVLWDMDGLLVDTEPVWTVAEEELAARLVERLYADGTGKPNKWWMSFQKRRFMSRSLGA